MISELRGPRIRPRGLVAAVAGSVLLTVVLAGCSQPAAESSSPSSTGDSPAMSEAPNADSPCALLDDAALESLIGDAPQGAEVTVPGSDLLACQFGDITQRGVQVAQVPAGEWAHSLPAMMEGLKALPAGTLDEDVLEQLENASDAVDAGTSIPADEACTYFSQLLELQGQEPGTTRVVSYYPDAESAIAITAQQCAAGTYTSILVGRTDLADDPGLADQLSGLLDSIG